MIKSGITQEELVGWGGVEVFNQAIRLCVAGDVHDVSYDDETLTVSGRIDQPGGFAMPVSFTLGPRRSVRSRCPCYANAKEGRICPHVVAVGYALLVAETDDPPAREEEETPPGEPVAEIPMTPLFYALVSGSRRSLSVEIDAYYGDVEFPACSPQAERTVYLRDENDPLVRRVRSPEAEKNAVRSLGEWGFEPGFRKGDLKLYLTDPRKVLTFLGAGVPALRRRGWRVDYAPRLAETAAAFRTVAPVVRLADAPGGGADVSYAFETAGAEVPPAEIQAALNRGESFLLDGDDVILFDAAAIGEMHALFRSCASRTATAARGWFRVDAVHAPYVHASLDGLDIACDASRAREWLETARRRNRDARTELEPVPLGPLENVLRPYQKQGVYWMRFLERAGFGGLLADEMGLGKTLQTLAWLSLARDGERGPSLVVCPTSLVHNWEAEAKKFTPWLRTLVLSGPDRAGRFAQMAQADLVVTSYALLQRDFDAAYDGVSFAAVVLDEAQRIKNRRTNNARAVKRLRCGRRLVLTGTPVENSVADVWSIFDFLLPGYLGEYERFKLEFETPIAEGGDAGEEAQRRLKRKLHPFILRRLKKTVAADLPDKIVKISHCPMDEDAQRDYVETLAETRRGVGELIRTKGLPGSRFEILAMLTRLRRIAADGKREAVLDQLRQAIAAGNRILVFSQFVTTLRRLAEALEEEGVRFCYLDGSTKNRLEECTRFNRDPSVPVFLVSLMAGGTGLNLTGANMVVHYDPWWNPAVEDQATDRAHRIGQKKIVYVVKMIASGSIEEKVLALQRRKQAVIAATVSTSDAETMASLTSEDLAALLD